MQSIKFNGQYRKRKFVLVALCAVLFSLGLAGLAYAGNPTLGAYVVIPVAEGGMKCMLKKDYSEFCIMPPGYSMRCQVFKRGSNGSGFALVTSGVTVTYAIENNTYSQNGAVPKTNFWTYASNFGWNLQMDTGTKGYKLSGTMVKTADGLGFEALKVPQTAYLNGTATTRTPYQNGVITVKDATTGATLATQKFCMPASDEQMCFECHGGTGGADTDRNIVATHDSKNGTTLATDGKANLCADCHADPSIGKAGNGVQKYLSTSMHSYHATRMGTKYSPKCYYCHPGPVTKCNRGAMSSGKACDNSGCHGSMATVGSTSRTPWSAASLPKCANCHSAIYAENTGKKYADSVLNNEHQWSAMNNKMYCQTCHGAQHAEWPSRNSVDNQVPIALTGVSYPIGKDWCGTCHATGGRIPYSENVHK